MLAWLDDGNFIFLGYRAYDLLTEDGEDQLCAVLDSGLGILLLVVLILLLSRRRV